MTTATKYIASSLSNVQVGGKYSQVVSIRFQAKTNSPLAAVRVYWIVDNPPTRAGYAGGKGGNYSYILRKDVDGQPGDVLATASVVQDRITGNLRGNFPLVCFPPVALVPGEWYGIVVQDMDSSPVDSWDSLNFLYNKDILNQTQDVQIWTATQGGPFAQQGASIGSPVAFFFADGTVQGHGDYEMDPTSKSGYKCGTPYGFPAAICQQP